mgnify:CR=1 FL=1
MDMKDIVVIGAGKIGGAIAVMLAETGDFSVVVADCSPEQLAKIDRHLSISTRELDITDHADVVALLKGKFAVLSAAPFNLTGRIAEAALEAGVHYLDLTEDVATTRKVEALSQNATRAFTALALANIYLCRSHLLGQVRP